MARTITIAPITRLEGHGSITLFLDDRGEVERALFQVPELRGFEAFCVGRLAEDMPQITSRICGICPTAHHLAATRALDDLFGVTPPLPALLIRQLFYNLFVFEDHLLHFYYLGAPDFIVGPDAPAACRNIIGVVQAVGLPVARRVVSARERCRALMAALGGKATHPVLGLPGGVSKPVTKELQAEVAAFAPEALDLAQFTLDAFHKLVLGNPEYLALIQSEHLRDETCYMGLVNAAGEVDFCGERARVTDSRGAQLERFAPRQYAEVLAEHVNDWTYVKFPYLRRRGWHGVCSGPDSSLVRVGPLARLNAAQTMATPRARAEHDRLYAALGGKPTHQVLAWHWARLIEVMQAAETIRDLAARPELTDPKVRSLELQTPRVGVGMIEAPRGTLIHHYETDANGVITACNLLVATVFNAAPIGLTIEHAARGLIHGDQVSPGLLNRVEMAFRAYDPCLSCATHQLAGGESLGLEVRNADGTRRGQVVRDAEGRQSYLPNAGPHAIDMAGRLPAGGNEPLRERNAQ